MRLEVATLLGVLFAANPALAHAHLRSALPEISAVGSAPAQLSLTFSEVLEPLLSRLTVIAPDGDAVAGAAPLVPSDDQRRMVLKLPKLSPGVYTVRWIAVSTDTHRSEGSYRFTVVP